MKNNMIAPAKRYLQKQKKKTKTEIIKFFAAEANTQFNMSVEFEGSNIVKEFSIGFVLRDATSVNMRSKTDSKTSSLCIFYNFINFGKYTLALPIDQDHSHKIALYKNIKNTFYGVNGTNTTKINLRVEKATEIYLVLMELYKIHLQNEKDIQFIKDSKDNNDPDIQTALQVQIELKKKIKAQFIDCIINSIKRYY